MGDGERSRGPSDYRRPGMYGGRGGHYGGEGGGPSNSPREGGYYNSGTSGGNSFSRAPLDRRPSYDRQAPPFGSPLGRTGMAGLLKAGEVLAAWLAFSQGLFAT